MAPSAEPLVIALGGNTLLGEDLPWTFEDQQGAITDTVERLQTVIPDDQPAVVTHGNGPQVGSLMIQQESVPDTPTLPLDVLVAETQAQIGYSLQAAFGANGTVSTQVILTRVRVNLDDAAFENATKPVGPWYTEAEATAKRFETRVVGSGDRPYRRVVPSPEPQDILERDQIEAALSRNDIVICGGGGGIPVTDLTGATGVEAVIDKDATSAQIGHDLGAGTLLVLTDVAHAYLDYATESQMPLTSVTPAECREHLENDEFGVGSMAPKVAACCRFVEMGGDRAIITDLAHVEAALTGDAGTQIRV